MHTFPSAYHSAQSVTSSTFSFVPSPFYRFHSHTSCCGKKKAAMKYLRSRQHYSFISLFSRASSSSPGISSPPLPCSKTLHAVHARLRG